MSIVHLMYFSWNINKIEVIIMSLGTSCSFQKMLTIFILKNNLILVVQHVYTIGSIHTFP